MMSGDRVTGSWVVLRQGMYLVATDGLHFEWNRNPADALVFPSKTAAQRIVGSKGTVVKRSTTWLPASGIPREASP